MPSKKKKSPCPECGEMFINVGAHKKVHSDKPSPLPPGNTNHSFTDLQRRAVEHYVKNGCKSLAASMRAVGYSENSTSTALKNSKGWQQLMDEYLPESKLAAVHKKLLEAKDTVFMKDETGKIKALERDDNRTIRAALNMGYKLHGNYAPEKIEMAKRQLSDMSDDELESEILEAKRQLGKE